MRLRDFLLAGFSTLALVQPARAQEAAPKDTRTSGLAEIVITAQKREQNLQSVPVSVTVLGADAIANQRITEFADVARAAASLTITQTSTSPNDTVILRGIGTAAFSIGVEPSVSVILDDMAVVQQAQAFDNLNDIERIEVLKGPQGTLFGKNASAGVINIVTKGPTRVLSGKLEGTVATDNDQRVDGVLSGPLSDNLGFRVTGFYHKYGGNIYDLTNGATLNDEENYGFRGKLRFEPAHNLTITLIGAYSKTKQNGTGSPIRAIYGTATPLVLSAVPLLPSLIGITPGQNNYNARIDVLGANDTEIASGSGRINYDLGFANLISITSYQDWKYNFLQDLDGTDIDVLAAFTKGAQHGSLVQSGPYHSTDLSQELRLVSSGHGPLNYVVGGYYADAKTTRSFMRGPAPASLLSDWFGTDTSNSRALFAQADYTLPTKTTVSGGVRYNHEKIGASFDNLLSTATANTCAPGNPLCTGTHDDSVVTWKVSVSQQFARHAMVYASVATGYKGYAFDVSSGFNPARINAALSGTGAGLIGVGPVKAEHSTSYEIGLKSRFLDNRAQFNLTGFYTDYNNFQAQSSTLLGSPPVYQAVLYNVGRLRTKGIESEFSLKPVDWLQLDGSAAYIDAVIASFPVAPNFNGQLNTDPACILAGGSGLCALQNLSGGHLPNSPKFKFSLAATADFPISATVKGLMTLNYLHQSSVNFDLAGDSYDTQKAYGILNSSLGADFGRVQISAFINNIFDTHYASSIGDAFNGSSVAQAHVIRPFLTRDSRRYAGVKVGASF